MMLSATLIASAGVLLSCIGTVAAQNADPIVIKGSKFFFSGNGTQL